MEAKPLLLLDGMSLAFRAYYALPPDLAMEDGTVTNALHGFVSMLASLVRDHEPAALVVAFDLPGGTFRDEIAEDYKGGRGETPEDLPPQFDMIRDVLGALAIPVVSREGFEADDVIATLATRARDEQRPVIIVTGDRDNYQLVEDPYIRVLYNKRGVSDYALYDEAGILERTGVKPSDYPFYAALRGDPSDNLPGVHGVGEKTAAKLVNEHGDLDRLMAAVDSLTPKLRENLVNDEPRVRINLQVMPLVRDVDLDVDPADFHLGGWSQEEAEATFARYELRSLWTRMSALMAAGLLGEPDGAAKVREAKTGKSAGRPQKASAPSEAAPLPVLSPDDQALAAFLAAGGSAWVGLDVDEEGEHLGLLPAPDAGGFVAHLEAALAGSQDAGPLELSGLDVKAICRALVDRGCEHPVVGLDLAVAAYLLDADRGDYDLATVAELAGTAVPAGPGGDASPAARLAHELGWGRAIGAALRERLEAEGLERLYEDIEAPLVAVLARMESRGIAVDRKALAKLADSLASQVAELEQMVYDLAGREFNLNSPAQLREVLFDELGLTPGRKTKTGYSTDAATLQSLRDEHPIVPAMLEYREYEKLRSTYGAPLLDEVGEDGRIHATFRQTVARTGRLSSESPNLHNIPVRSSLGAQFRDLFVPTKGWQLLAADYDQIELRIIAHLSGDEGLIAAFTSGEDVHAQVAASVFGVGIGEVTKAQREKAKTVSYGLAYGMEAYGLAQRMQTTPAEAAEVMEDYFSAFPGVKAYQERAVAEAKAQGYTRTAFGRIRPMADLASSNFRVRTAAERQAMNAGIQGLAADIFKFALVRLDRSLAQAGLEARIVLQVHDEILVEAPKAEQDAAERLTLEAMGGAAELAVPLKVSAGWGKTWGAAKGG